MGLQFKTYPNNATAAEVVIHGLAAHNGSRALRTLIHIVVGPSTALVLQPMGYCYRARQRTVCVSGILPLALRTAQNLRLRKGEGG